MASEAEVQHSVESSPDFLLFVSCPLHGSIPLVWMMLPIHSCFFANSNSDTFSLHQASCGGFGEVISACFCQRLVFSIYFLDSEALATVLDSVVGLVLLLVVHSRLTFSNRNPSPAGVSFFELR